MTSESGARVTGKENLVTQPCLSKLPRKGSVAYCDLITRKQGGDPFIRRTVVNGRPYWQRCRYIYRDGHRRLLIVEHLGNRKPRGGKR